MIRLMGMENISTLMVLNMKGTGKKINSMDMGKRYGLMGLNLKGIILMVRNKEKEPSLGRMEVHIKETFMKIIFMVGEFTVGLMAGYIMAHGNVTKCMDMVYLLGQMGESMRESMLMTRSKVKVCSNGLMVENTLVDG